MKQLAILAILLTVGGCASFDEHPIKTATETRAITLERRHDALEECRRLGTKAAPGWVVEACTVIVQTPCRIIALPDVSDDILGHEAQHCFDGAWHR